MRFVSTRGGAAASCFSEAIVHGLAPDGGLYVPEAFPQFDPDRLPADRFAPMAARILAPFFSGDPLESQLEAICEEAFDFPLLLETLPRETSVLELFHGPTLAFKDVAMQLLARLMDRALTRRKSRA